MDRREFLKLMGVASGTSVLAGCNLDRKTEKLIPYLVPPEDGVIPGDATYTPSTCTECPANCGLLVTVKEARPTKLDGLPAHPVGGGALCVRGQASLWRLYDDERIREPLVKNPDGQLVPSTWHQAYATIAQSLQSGKENVYISRRTTGTISELIGEFCTRLGVTRLPEFELFSYGAIREANRQLFGTAVVPAPRFREADFILTVGADVLETYGNPVENTRDIADARSGEDAHFNWYHVEPHASLTGFGATHRLVVRPGSEMHLLAYLLRELRSRRVFNDGRLEGHLSAVPVVDVEEAASVTGSSREALSALADDFLSARHPLVIAGGVSTRQPGGVAVARAAALLQHASGMIGKTVDFAGGLDFSRVGSPKDITGLTGRLGAGRVGVVFIADADPISDLPPDAAEGFAGAMRKANLTVGIGGRLTGTLSLCDIVLPESHALESWGDAEPRPGVVTVVQPVIEPLHDTRMLGDILLQILAASGRGVAADAYRDYLVRAWRRRFGAGAAEALITEGFMVYRPRGVSSSVSLSSQTGSYALPGPPSAPALVVAPSLRFYDGRSRTIPLLREIPDPLSSVTWDRWLSISPAVAADLSLKDGDWVEVETGDWRAQLPVMKQPGLPAGVVMAEHGATPSPALLDGSTGEVAAVTAGVSLRKIAGKEPLAYLSGSKKVDTKGNIPLQHIPHHHHVEGLPREDITFFPVPDYPEYRWAMGIDLDRCTGCSACVAACYLENNVPVVGREEHLKGREMAWLTIQPYFDDDDTAEFMPVMCQHCDNAPCEPVCPVFATYHNDEGLNAQVYNRCVGTRYCSNNCPYKVRRFNWFNNHHEPPPLDQLFNPDVSRRGKGIMEKCSFCVQRIRKARDIAKDEKRKIGADEVVTACAQACPAEAIVFGNIKDEHSQVAQWARSRRSNLALEELGTGPAVYYLTNKGNGDEHA